MIKVVYDYQVFEWQKYGGVSRYICEIASHLSQEKDLKVKILALANINGYLKNYSSDLAVGFTVPNLKKTGRIRRIFNANISRLLLSSNPPDIIHKTYYLSHKLAPKKTKVVVTIHDMLQEKFRQYFPGKTSQEKAKSVEQADHIICVSENSKRDLIEILKVDPNKVSVIYLGCSLKFNENQPFNSKISAPYILFVGDREGYKNFDRLLKAYASSNQLNRDFKLVCFGRKPLLRQELNLIHDLGLSEGQVLQASGDDTALTHYYQNASLLVYPSLYEGFGIPLIEAMSLHCPVACSNISSMPEVAGNAAEFFDPYEPDSIAAALEEVLYSSERTANLVNLGIERAKKFTWQACAEQTRSIYLSLV